MDVVIEMTSHSDQLYEKLKIGKEFATRKPREKWCIYQMPRCLKDVQKDKKAYEPRTVSIGPYHCGGEQVRDMVIYKWVALHQILERTKQDLNLFFDSIKKVEEQARACYQKDVTHVSSNDFVEMLVLDGCFILEFLLCNLEFPDQMIKHDILLDILMLENQLPYFIIDKLYRLMRPADDTNELSAMNLALITINPGLLTGKTLSLEELKELMSSIKQEECLHVLDVFMRSLFLTRPQEGTKTRKIGEHRQVIRKVTDLKDGGVIFRMRVTDCFWDIRFKNGVLEIPPILIQDKTRAILLNVAAFENCHLEIKNAVMASYVVFMECLMKSPEDVSHLHSQGIIQHLLGSDAEVVDMFMNVSKNMLVARDDYYAEISYQVNAYCNRRRNRWRANLLQNYFNSPWVIISLVSALIILLLTTIQSFYAVYAYYKPPKS